MTNEQQRLVTRQEAQARQQAQPGRRPRPGMVITALVDLDETLAFLQRIVPTVVGEAPRARILSLRFGVRRAQNQCAVPSALT